ncbi:IclR family transcriptional regulator [Roseixanthobacter pseudopolyaromaticivorans]|uniref:IclR family transcriptional regulator n=1 Tax=Xanthobacteraceae TaxID=335928 RepID=UPI003726E959
MRNNGKSEASNGAATPAIINALAILESFDEKTPALSLSELSRKLGIAKASVFRNLNALEQCGYVVKSPRDGTYSLGVKVLDLARRFSEKDHFLSIGSAHTRELSRVTGETSHLAILDGPDIVYVDVSEGSQLIRAVVGRGDRLPAHSVASGKAILAYSPRDKVIEFLSRGLKSLTPETMTSSEDLLTDFERVRERGYATNIGESASDVSAVAVPIFSHDDQVVGAIGIAGPRLRLGAKMLAYLATAIQAQAQRFSAELGASSSRSGAPASDASDVLAGLKKRRKLAAA